MTATADNGDEPDPHRRRGMRRAALFLLDFPTFWGMVTLWLISITLLRTLSWLERFLGYPLAEPFIRFLDNMGEFG